jgi:2-oxoglutarate dehydrogenase E2 component (dihydrolipoamide succinyltransferase)|tara:strand:- start:916 stop:2190 length:1275 start_codon:yes stop_codon:yes gene_type:complete
MNKVEMVMPKMGESIMEGTILKWLKIEGDNINEDESVLEVATDKVDTEIPSTCSGKILKILVEEGDIVKVGSPIAVIETSDDISIPNSFIDELEKDFKEIKKEISPSPQKITPNNDVKNSDKFFSPLVLNIASRENISLNTLEKIKGTGENQRVTKLDLLKYLEEKNYSTKNELDTTKFDQEIILKEGEELIEPDRVRKIIAKRMVDSKRISPHVTSFVEADITNVYNDRKKIKDDFLNKNGFPITFNPIFIKCVTDALKDFPMMNISYINEKIIKKNYINIGIAVALEDDNLIVPVLKNSDKMSFMDLVKNSNELINNTRNNKLTPDDLDGGTFTISNVGSFGNVMGTPIILQPQVGILAIGSIRKIPSVVETKNGDKIEIRNKLYLSHTYDHRIIDGAIGGKFAQKIANYIENFDLMSIITV